ncbi:MULTISPECIES: sulfate ABC transporter substrate-binding protein [unclassified Rhizobium]|uniref:sulfate ABC transporter substrate-binding protein n=1 Tax=unclassified Rhizobium TaxID=2613769 RepID=UPI001ADACF87|nr:MULTISPECIES: sulfate ABC transporter substrate-binding protein [unclassified Rhizobium]MBO9097043.1 sulfate ABC transporter substrate-binding protein [Rhizobium sp. L58/93]MBO9167281.1 sulfate ABC transporter substrate-binding protein [Rhizobium sp. L245/93]MBO9183240.1 sulfate ABC transporter substrate-binding protein [Rhizobium sp. E27B/91]QXZ83584.1 sulfate ABC transporter substrate-binding protein [Rhizobium sp. K1/93]QXZ88904.1 sulfate ABC transporter substrate-binding protein [Rhizob
MQTLRLSRLLATAVLIGSFSLSELAPVFAAEQTLLNVSYDPTRELYKDFNAAFAAKWKKDTGETVELKASHGGSGAQARSVIDGLNADVVTLALEGDIDAISKATNKIPADWNTKFPNKSVPYTSTIVFLVRKGNPKAIKDWPDLIKDGVQVITPNPKTSGGARWNILAAYAWAKEANGGDDAKAEEYLSKLLKHVPVLDSGARGATTTFVQRGLGDVLLAWENEAYLSLEELGPDKFEIVTPSVSIRADPPVAVVDGNVDKKGTRRLAEAYLNYLYSDDGQKIAAAHYYRPIKPAAADPKDIARFPNLKLASIDDFGGWKVAQPKFFADGGIFDKIYKPGQ